MKEIINQLSITETEKRAFLFIVFGSFIALFSLFQANVLYADDIGRVISGYPGWVQDGRPATNIIIILMQLGKPLTDISPLPQLLAIVFYALSSIYLGKAFEVKNLIFLTLIGLCFVLNPFNLQNFCFIFDAFTMGLAVFTATMSFYMAKISFDVFLSRGMKLLLYAFILGLLLITLTLYQFGTSIYIGISAFYLLTELLESHRSKESIQRFTCFVVPLLLALALYIPIKNATVDNQYISSKTGIPSLLEIPAVVWDNFISSMEYIFEVLGGSSNLLELIFILALGVGLQVFLLLLELIIGQKSKGLNLFQKTSCFLLALFYMACIFLSFYGISLIFSGQSAAYLPRFFMGFSAVVGASCWFLARYYFRKRVLRYALISFLSVLCLSFINVSLTLGNSLYYQNLKEEAVATMLLSDLNSIVPGLNSTSEKPKVAFLNELDYSNMTDQAFSKYPIVKETVISYFREGWWQTHNRLVELGFELYERGTVSESPLPREPSENPNEASFGSQYKLIANRHTYDIYLQGEDTLLVWFKAGM